MAQQQSNFEVETVETKPYAGQRPGTSGLRKKVKEVQQPHYLENFVQAIFDGLPQQTVHGSTIVVGGDGRYYNKEAIQIIIKIAAANGVAKLLIAKDGIFSTPAVSSTIRARKCTGGILLTASHNPAGPDNDFGIKYNVSNGGPAPESVTEAIFEKTKSIKHYKLAKLPDVDLSKLHTQSWNNFSVEIIDGMGDYLPLLRQIFDFDQISKLLKRPDFKVLFDSLHGVTGPYARHIFVDVLGAPAESVTNAEVLPDFGGGHPDPNLTYAKHLVDRVNSPQENIEFGCAWDGDGDRNMIIGKNFFVTPSDSLAVIVANATVIPYFRDGLKACSRSMPTSAAVDMVAKQLGIPLYEVPTGWKFFGNLMDKYEKEGSHGFVCGEESFGTGSAHIREKDGIWATLAWLSIISAKNTSSAEGKLVTVADIVKQHWKTYGRNYYCRYDYESVDAASADKMMQHLTGILGKSKEGDKYGNFALKVADEFEYKDPVDHSVSSHQGVRFVFQDGSRFVVRLSGTGSVGATIRLYLEKYEKDKVDLSQEEALGALIKVALSTMDLKTFIGTEEPTVIT